MICMSHVFDSAPLILFSLYKSQVPAFTFVIKRIKLTEISAFFDISLLMAKIFSLLVRKVLELMIITGYCAFTGEVAEWSKALPC